MLEHDYLRGMGSVKVKTADVLAALTENAESHRSQFEEAMEGYRSKAVLILREHIDRILANAPEKVMVSLPMPEDHSKDYERAILMLNMSQDEYLELQQHEFAQYVMDDWGWKQEFATTYAAYTSTS